MRAVGFDQLEQLGIDDLHPRDRRLTLASLGFQPGDVFSIERDNGEDHYELPCQPL